MRFQQTKPTARGYHYRVVATALAMLVLLLSLASVSPALHESLHADSECSHHHDEHIPEHSDSDQTDEQSSHYCAVTLLNSGVTFSIQVELPQLGNVLLTVLSVQHDTIWYRRPCRSQSARGPPTLIVV